MNDEKKYAYQNLDINDLPNEEWKNIENYPNYKVSSWGRIKSLEKQMKYRYGYCTHKERIIKQTVNKTKYLQATLYNKDGYKRINVHRIVATAFIPNPDNLEQINHKSEDRKDNIVSNLEWCTRKYNCNYGTHNKKLSIAGRNRFVSQETRIKMSKALKGKKRTPEAIERSAKSHYKAIVQLDENNVGRKWDAAIIAQREADFNQGSIIKCCKNKYNKKGNNIYKGYKFQYFTPPTLYIK